MPKPKPILAWHFLYDTGCMRNGRKPRKIETHKGQIILCEAGLHASVELLDALPYAPGSILCRVRCSGEIVKGKDKLVCSRREILWRVDARDALREFARRCALRAARVHTAKACERAGMADRAKALRALPDNATPAQIERAARAAARDAAWAAGEAAAWAAERKHQSVLLLRMIRKLPKLREQ